MMKKVLSDIWASVRELARRWPMTASFLGLYTLLVASVYAFAAVGQARLWQVLLTLLLFLAAPVLFFVLHRMVLSFSDTEEAPHNLLLSSLKDFWRLAVVTVPPVLAALLINYLLGKLQAHLPSPLYWSRWTPVVFSALRLLLFGLALPLALVGLWLASLKNGFKEIFGRSRQIFSRAFEPQSVMIYLLGTPFFVLIPYFLLITKTPAQKASTEIGLFVGRIALALIFMLFGWLVTVGALKRSSL